MWLFLKIPQFYQLDDSIGVVIISQDTKVLSIYSFRCKIKSNFFKLSLETEKRDESLFDSSSLSIIILYLYNMIIDNEELIV